MRNRKIVHSLSSTRRLHFHTISWLCFHLFSLSLSVIFSFDFQKLFGSVSAYVGGCFLGKVRAVERLMKCDARERETPCIRYYHEMYDVIIRADSSS